MPHVEISDTRECQVCFVHVGFMFGFVQYYIKRLHINFHASIANVLFSINVFLLFMLFTMFQISNLGETLLKYYNIYQVGVSFELKN